MRVFCVPSTVPDTWAMKVNERATVSLLRVRPLGSSMDG